MAQAYYKQGDPRNNPTPKGTPTLNFRVVMGSTGDCNLRQGSGRKLLHTVEAKDPRRGMAEEE